jgi:hypothetical protein
MIWVAFPRQNSRILVLRELMKPIPSFEHRLSMCPSGFTASDVFPRCENGTGAICRSYQPRHAMVRSPGSQVPLSFDHFCAPHTPCKSPSATCPAQLIGTISDTLSRIDSRNA